MHVRCPHSCPGADIEFTISTFVFLEIIERGRGENIITYCFLSESGMSFNYMMLMMINIYRMKSVPYLHVRIPLNTNGQN